MADQQNRGGQQPGTTNPAGPNPDAVGADRKHTNDNAGQRHDRDTDRDRQNRDDPSRAPESGDRK